MADVEAADFNGDGTLDLAVAAFGWRRSGNLSVLENHTVDYSHPSFESRLVDPRPGAIHAIPVDLNGDGRPGSWSRLRAAVRAGGGVHQQRHASSQLHAPGDLHRPRIPNWGSSGIEVVDLDGDGDLDVLLTHGDTFDDAIIKPYHGIQWLENRGTFPFTEHTLARSARREPCGGRGPRWRRRSRHRGECVDVADDGETAGLPSMVWLEQTRPGVFVGHVIEVGLPARDAGGGDDHHDGDVDIVVGNFSFGPPVEGWFEVLENLRVKVQK